MSLIKILNIFQFAWLISFAFASWYNELQALIVFGFLVVITQQYINMRYLEKMIEGK